MQRKSPSRRHHGSNQDLKNVVSCVNTNIDRYSFRKKMLYKEQLMKQAEQLILQKKAKQIVNVYEDLKFKIFGKEKFESKTNYCD